MGNQVTQEIVLKIRAQANELEQELKKTQSSLANLSLNNNLGKDVTALSKKFEQIQKDAEKGFTTKGDFTKILNDLSAFDSRLAKIKETIDNIQKNPEKLIEFASPEQRKQLDAYSDAQDKIKANLKEIEKLNKDIEKQNAKSTVATTRLDSVQAERKKLDSQKKDIEQKTKLYNNLASAIELAKKRRDALNAAERSKKESTKQKYLELAEQQLAPLQNIAKEFQKNGGDSVIASNIRNGNYDEVKKAADEASNSIKEYNKTLDANKKAEASAAQEVKNNADNIQQLKQSINNIETDSLDKIHTALSEAGIDTNNIQSVEQFNTVVKELTNEITQQVLASLNEFGIDVENLGKHVSTASDEIDKGKESLIAYEQTVQRTEAFANRLKATIGLAGGYRILRQAVQSAMETIKTLDATMTNTAVVTDFTVSDMWSQLSEYTQRANELGVAINDVYEASTLYYQQGLKTNEVTQITTATMKMARIAGLDAEEATQRMTNALRGFNMEIDEMNANNVADVYSKLASITASNVDQISTAMTKVASLANSAGMSFENTAAFLAQIIESTQESAETAGTALKTVIARFSEIKENPALLQDSEGEEISYNKIDTALKSIGISMDAFMKGEEGLDEVFKRLAQQWNGLDKTTQRYIATQAAGSRQQSRFIALMSNYQRTMELTEAASSASGAANAQYAKTLESMQTKLQRLKNAWDEFTMGILNSTFFKGVVDSLTKILELVNKITGSLGSFGGIVAKLGLLFGALTLVTTGINAVASAMIKYAASTVTSSVATDQLNRSLARLQVMKASTVIGALTSSLKTLATGFNLARIGSVNFSTEAFKLTSTSFKLGATLGKIMTVALANWPIVLGAIALSLGAVIVGVNVYHNSLTYLNKVYEESKQKAEDARAVYESEKNTLQNLTEQVKELNTKRLTDGLTQAEQEQLAALNEKLNIQKQIVEEKQKEYEISQQQANDDALEVIKKTRSKSAQQTATVRANMVTDDGDQNAINKAVKENEKLYNEALDKYSNMTKGTAKTQAKSELNNILIDWFKSSKEANLMSGDEGYLGINDFIKKAFADNIDIIDTYISGLRNKQGELLEDKEITPEAIAKLFGAEAFAEGGIFDSIGIKADELVDHFKALNNEIKTTGTTFKTFSASDAITELTGIEGKIKNLTSALSEFNSDNEVSLSTIDSIREAFADIIPEATLNDALKSLSVATTLDEVKSAVNQVATAYLNSDAVINTLTEDTKALHIAELKKMGVTNAEALVEWKLIKGKIANGTATQEEIDKYNKLIKNHQEYYKSLKIDIQTQALLAQWDATTASNLQALADKYKNSSKQAANYASALFFLTKAQATYDKVVASGEDGYWEKDDEGSYWVGLDKLETNLTKAKNELAKAQEEWAQVGIANATVDATDLSKASESYWTNPLEKHYNLLQQITKEQTKLTNLANEYAIATSRIYTDNANNMKEICDLMAQQEESYARQLGYQSRLTYGYQQDLLGLNAKYGDTAENYLKFDEKTGTLVVKNEQAWQDLEDGKLPADSELGKKLNAMKDEYTDFFSKWEDSKKTELELQKSYEERRNSASNTMSSLINQFADQLYEQDRRKVELLQSQLDATEEANNRLISSIRSNFDKLRKDRDNADTEDEISDLAKKIAYLKQDTSGSNAVQIKQLEKQLREKQQNYTDSLIDQAIDDQENQYDEAHEQRQRQIDLMESQYNYDKEHGIYKVDAEKMIKDAIEKIANNEYDTLDNELMDLFKSIQLDASTWEINAQANSIATSLSEIYTYLSKDNKKLGMDALAKGDYDAALTYAENYLTEAKNSKMNVNDAKAGLMELLGIKSGVNMDEAASAAYASGNKAYGDLINTLRDEFITSYGLTAKTGYNYPQGQFNTPAVTLSPSTTTKSDLDDDTINKLKKASAINDAVGYKNKNTDDIKAIQTALFYMHYLSEEKDIDGIFGSKTFMAVQQFQKDNGLKDDGYWGQKTSAVFAELLKTKYKVFATGGLANFTGPAWLDGTTSRPELVLNARDTENFIQLKDILRGLFGANTTNNSIGDSYVNVDVNVGSVDSQYDIEQIIQDIKYSIYKDSMYRNVNFVSTLK